VRCSTYDSIPRAQLEVERALHPDRAVHELGDEAAVARVAAKVTGEDAELARIADEARLKLRRTLSRPEASAIRPDARPARPTPVSPGRGLPSVWGWKNSRQSSWVKATGRRALNAIDNGDGIASPPLQEDVMLLLKALLYIVSVIIAFWAIVLIVARDTSRDLGKTRRRVRHRR
jgi:hypothetical protein